MSQSISWNRSLFKVSPFLVAFAALVIGAICSLVFAESASAHGYITGPASRAALCNQGINKNCGAIVYEPQSLEAPGSYPTGGPADGQIAGAGAAFPELNAQTADRWSKVNINSGSNTFTWKLTAAHATREWKYYITKTGWNPNAALKRSDFELFCSFNDGGKKPNPSTSHTCDVPARSGYNVILAVWEIADTPNAFYNVIDVNVNGGGTGTPTDNQAPTVPAGVTASGVTANSVTLNWSASSDNVGVTGYDVYQGSTLVGTSTTTSFTVTGLAADTSYTFTVKAKDAAGNTSAASSAVTAKTTAGGTGGTTAPAWSASSVYTAGNRVTYNGVVYEAKWWTQGETPGKADVWKTV
ncbi:lytic polysaccharide monooxygenase [Paenibacillus chitinolyticus]|uniref:lytic polysaccharide monooxygenase n=1 Tax=Paenibacillus chitinolyticus TaxID=79263 RepID=UPI003556594B